MSAKVKSMDMDQVQINRTYHLTRSLNCNRLCPARIPCSLNMSAGV